LSTPLPFWTCIIVGKKKWWPRSLLLKIIWLYFINALNPLYLQEQCIVHPHTTHFEDNHFSRHRSYLHQKEKSIKLVHIKGSIRDPIRIYKTKILGSRGCREKNPPNCHKYATFWGGLFNFWWAKKSNYLSKIL
jgi:hypothetical protein